MSKQKYVLLTPIADLYFDKPRPPPDSSPHLLFYIASLFLTVCKNDGCKGTGFLLTWQYLFLSKLLLTLCLNSFYIPNKGYINCIIYRLFLFRWNAKIYYKLAVSVSRCTSGVLHRGSTPASHPYNSFIISAKILLCLQKVYLCTFFYKMFLW